MSMCEGRRWERGEGGRGEKEEGVGTPVRIQGLTLQEHSLINNFLFQAVLTNYNVTEALISLQTWRLHVWDQSSEHTLPRAEGM